MDRLLVENKEEGRGGEGVKRREEWVGGLR